MYAILEYSDKKNKERIFHWQSRFHEMYLRGCVQKFSSVCYLIKNKFDLYLSFFFLPNLKQFEHLQETEVPTVIHRMIFPTQWAAKYSTVLNQKQIGTIVMNVY